jgi:small conductance mechanosensitive channel
MLAGAGVAIGAAWSGMLGNFAAGAADPPPDVSLLDINLVGTVIAVRPYTHTDHYWQVYFDTNEAIVRVAREAGWPAPTPSQIIHRA